MHRTRPAEAGTPALAYSLQAILLHTAIDFDPQLTVSPTQLGTTTKPPHWNVDTALSSDIADRAPNTIDTASLNKTSSERRFVKLRRRFWKTLWFVAALILVAILFRNPITLFCAPKIVAALVEAEIKIDHVSIGWSRIDLLGLTVGEPGLCQQNDDSLAYLHVQELSLTLSLSEGVRSGCWVEHLRVVEPSLTLRFDASGKLLTKFPASESKSTSPDSRLPIRSLIVDNARITIEQPDHESLVIDQIRVDGNVADRAKLSVVVPNVLGGQVKANVEFDTRLASGQSKLSMDRLTLDTDQLQKLPLLDQLATIPPCRGLLSISLVANHHDLLSVTSNDLLLKVAINDIALANSSQDTTSATGIIKLDKGEFNARLEFNPFNSVSLAVASGQISDSEINLNWKCKLSDLDLANVTKVLAPDQSVSGDFSGDTVGSLKVANREIRGSARARSALTGLTYSDRQLGSCNTSWDCDFYLPLASPEQCSGGINGHIEKGPVHLSTFLGDSADSGLSGSAEATVDLHYNLAELGSLLFSNERKASASLATSESQPAAASNDQSLQTALQLLRPLKGHVSMRCQELTWRDSVVPDFTADVELEQCQIVLKPVVISALDQHLHLSGHGNISERAEAHLHLHSDRVDLRRIASELKRYSATPLPIKGIAQIDGTANCSFPLVGDEEKRVSFLAQGRLNATDLSYANTHIGSTELAWNASQAGLTIDSGSKDWLGGSYRATISMNDLDWTRAVCNVQLRELPLKGILRLAKIQTPCRGNLNGTIVLTSFARPETLVARCRIETTDLVYADIPIDPILINLDAKNGRVVASADSGFSSGLIKAELAGELVKVISHFREGRPPELIPLVGQVVISDISLSRVARNIPASRSALDLRGLVGITVTRTPAGLASGEVARFKASIRGIAYKGVPTVGRLSVDGQLSADGTVTSKLLGDLLGGQASGQVDLNLKSGPRGRVNLEFSNLALDRAGKIAADLPITGEANLFIKAELGNTVRGTILTTANHVRSGGAKVDSVRLPVRFDFDHKTMTASWNCDSGIVAAGGGHIRIETEGRYASSLDFEQRFKIEHVDVGKVIPVGSALGVVDGDIRLSSKRFRAPQDLSGSFSFYLSNPEPLQISALSQIPTLSLSSISTPGYGEAGGVLKGRLRNGTLHLEDAAMWTNNVQLYADGTVNLDGRLNLEVIAATESTSPADSLLELMDNPLMMTASAPAALIAKANDALRDRVIMAKVAGTTDRPILQVNPGKQLSREAVQFFLKSTLGSTATNVLSKSNQLQSTRR